MKALILKNLSPIFLLLTLNDYALAGLLGTEPLVSRLCYDRNLSTSVVFSTENYNIAICKSGDGKFYYSGQDKQDLNSQIFLPILENNNPNAGANPWILRAFNGPFIYQVSVYDPWDDPSGAIDIFRDGTIIDHQTTDDVQLIGL